MSDRENRMGTMPIRRLILYMAWPMMCSMLISALYNMVDSYFVARLSEEAFIALSLVYPVQSFMVAVDVGVGVGVVAVLSRCLGEHRDEQAARVGMNGFFLYVLCWGLYLLFGLTCSGPFLRFFTADPLVASLGERYLFIVTVFSLGKCLQFATERVLQAAGDPVGPMVIQGVGAVANILLDPVLIFGLGPIPALGVAGAALATVLGQFLGAGVGLVLVARSKNLSLPFRTFRPDAAILGEILRIGTPAIAMQALGTVMTLVMNKLLALSAITALYGDAPVFILGAYFKLQTFVVMPIAGMTNGLTPVLSYNYGAKSRRRITEGVRFALTLALLLMAASALVFLLLPAALMRIFSAEGDTLVWGVSALRIIAPSFLFAGVSLILSSAFQALGASGHSLTVSILRQLVPVLPLCAFLAVRAPALVWLAIPVSEVLACAVAVLLFRRVYRRKIAVLPEE